MRRVRDKKGLFERALNRSAPVPDLDETGFEPAHESEPRRPT